jgi:hypothetical protein
VIGAAAFRRGPGDDMPLVPLGILQGK